MAWQKRNMFSSAVDMQRGGSVPWPSYEGGGIIGATPKERKRMFTIWDKMTQGQKEKVMDGKRYQMGGAVMPTQLFEEGDQDINMALNNMVSMTNPSLEQIGETEAVSIGPSMEGEMAMDQGPASFETDLMDLKDEYTQEIMSYIGKPGAIEKLEPFLKTMQLSYDKDLTELRKKYDMKEYSPEQELFTPEFMAQIQQTFCGDVPGMKEGGITMPTTQAQLDSVFSAFPGQYTLAEFNMFPEETKRMLITRALIEKGTKGASTSPLDVVYREGTDKDDPVTVKQRLNQIIEERMKLAKRSAEMPLTTQGGFGGFVEQMNAYRANQAAAQDKVLEDELDMLQYGNRYGTRGLGDISIPADTMNKMIAGDDMDKNDQAMLKLAQGQAKSVDDENPLLGVVYFRKFSPDGFLRVFPHYSGTKTIGGKEYTIDEYITYMIEEAKATGADEATKDEIASIALGSWLTAIAGEVDPLGIRG